MGRGFGTSLLPKAAAAPFSMDSSTYLWPSDCSPLKGINKLPGAIFLESIETPSIIVSENEDYHFLHRNHFGDLLNVRFIIPLSSMTLTKKQTRQFTVSPFLCLFKKYILYFVFRHVFLLQGQLGAQLIVDIQHPYASIEAGTC